MSSSENTKLIATAAGAAIAGAALAMAAMKLAAPKEEEGPTLPRKMSFIYEEPGTSATEMLGSHASSSTLLFPHNHEDKMRRAIATRAAVDEENVTPRRSVTVRVPATSANMGPGCEYSAVL
jgi:hypothetical protein